MIVSAALARSASRSERIDMSSATLVRHSQRHPFSELREARHQRALQISAVISGIAGVTATALALVTIGLGA
jgi:hypothetical protein